MSSDSAAANDSSSEDGTVGRSGDSDGLLSDGPVTRPSSDSPRPDLDTLCCKTSMDEYHLWRFLQVIAAVIVFYVVLFIGSALNLI